MLGETQTLPPSFSQKPVSPPLLPQLPSPSRTQFLVCWPSSQISLSSGTPKGVPVSLSSHTPAPRDLSCHPRVTCSPGPRPGGLYQFWLPPALVGGAPSYTWDLATPAGAVGETLAGGEEWLAGTCGSRGVSGVPRKENKGWGVMLGKVRMAVPLEWPNAM